MFAVVETGGKQYKLEKGTKLEVERLSGEEGSSLDLDKVLLIGENGNTTIGTPYISGAAVSVKIVGHKRGEKIVVFKMKPKKRYQKKQGHRQELTVIEVTEIKASGAKAPAAKEAAPKKKEEEKKEA